MLPYAQVTKDHLKAVLVGSKDFLKMKEVSFINPPNWDEIGVKFGLRVRPGAKMGRNLDVIWSDVLA